MFKGKYSNPISHRIMISDTYRTHSYEQAIKNNIAPGDIVVDFGAGTGILSLLCAHYGAKKVYAVEQNPTIRKILKHNIELNNFQNKIEIFAGTTEEFINEFTGDVDLLISECIGDHLFESRILYDFLVFKDKLDIGKTIPQRFGLYCYGNFVKQKRHLVDLPIKLDDGEKIITNEFLDVSYFVNNSDVKCPYFKLDHSNEEHTLFEFSSLSELELYNNQFIKKTVDFHTKPDYNNYAMLYFKVMLDSITLFTNHPSRYEDVNKKGNYHSYYQRLVNLSDLTSKKITFIIDVLDNTSGLEDIPFPNISVQNGE